MTVKRLPPSTARQTQMAALLAAIVAAQAVDPCRYQHDWDDRNHEPPVCTQCGLVWQDAEPGGTRQPREGETDGEKDEERPRSRD
jgi:hypothetical protein